MTDRSDVSVKFLTNMASYLSHEVATGLDVAAAEIERLRKLNTELVEGLRWIAGYEQNDIDDVDARTIIRRARELLKKVEG